jgi:DNA adenine methylase
MHARLQGQYGRIATAARRLAAVTLECMPAVDLIRRYGIEPTVAIYADPPYVRSTRNSSHYRQEMTADDDHRELAAALAECRASVLLSGYHSDLYDQLYDGWHRLEIDTFSGQSGQKKPRTEVLWSNRPFPSRQAGLFDDLEAS